MTVRYVMRANAKLNLYLDIVGRRSDGYHLLETVMQSISLADDVTVDITDGGSGISISCDREDVPVDGSNTAYRAAELFLKAAGVAAKADIKIGKRIPSGAGMGGGSADAAAVLTALCGEYGGALTKQELSEIAAKVGADVPFCLEGGTKLCRGIGEELSDFPEVSGAFLVVKPDFGVSTAAAYKKYDERPTAPHGGLEEYRKAVSGGDCCGGLYNAFRVLFGDERIEALCGRLENSGARGAMMTGSGSAVFGVFDSVEEAIKASGNFPDCFSAVCTAEKCGVSI